MKDGGRAQIYAALNVLLIQERPEDGGEMLCDAMEEVEETRIVVVPMDWRTW